MWPRVANEARHQRLLCRFPITKSPQSHLLPFILVALDAYRGDQVFQASRL